MVYDLMRPPAKCVPNKFRILKERRAHSGAKTIYCIRFLVLNENSGPIFLPLI